MLLTATLQDVHTDWPAEVDIIISALEAAHAEDHERRGPDRMSYRVVAGLRLFSHIDDEPVHLFTRDVNARGLGFITRHRLPLGYGGMVEIALPDGEIVEVHCSILRCRQAAPGWYEGALHFTKAQKAFLIKENTDR